MSRTLSISWGSGESLNVSLRWGWRPNARQMRLTVIALRPVVFAMPRVLQCVASRGGVSNVRTITASIWASVIRRGPPRRGSSSRPATRAVTKRWRHLPTVAGFTRSCRATR